ncbi:MAG: hypothetical protein JOZ68_00890 [Acidimicrobiia bacterium]|nr:hypothetical protein [Acidimicrobiia bacterium]MBV9285417.1 hypothetical protein [Acidimicrobiia bacterium]
MVDGPALEAARVLACVTVAELWLRYFTLGGSNSRADLNALLRGDITFGAAQYDVLAHALNERFVELDLDHPVPYARDPR